MRAEKIHLFLLVDMYSRRILLADTFDFLVFPFLRKGRKEAIFP